MRDTGIQRQRGHLDALLTRSAAFGTSPRRRSEYDAPEDAVGFVAECVDMCVLPRRLEVYASGALCCTIIASNGKIIGLTDASGRVAGLEDPSEASDAGEMSLDGVRQDLLACFAEPGWVELAAHPAEIDESALLTGIRGRDLLASLGLSTISALEADRFEVFESGLADVLEATVTRDGGVALAPGTSDLPDDLLPYIRAKAAALEAAPAPYTSDDVGLFCPASQPDRCVAIHLQAHHGWTAFVLSRDALEQAAEFWSSLPTMLAATE